MGVEGILAMLVIGAVAGWLAGRLVTGYGFGVVGNIAVGIVGAFIASLFLPAIGLSLGSGTGAAIVHSTIGAVVLLILIRLVKKGT